VLVVGILGLALLSPVQKQNSVVLPEASSQAAQPTKPPATNIRSFIDGYREALIRQSPDAMLRYFSGWRHERMVLYYGKRITEEDFIRTLRASADSDPIKVHRVTAEEILLVSSPRLNCKGYIATLTLDLETQTQRRMKDIRLYILEPEPGRFFIVAENNVQRLDPEQEPESFAEEFSRSLVRQEPDNLIRLYPELTSSRKVSYYGKERASTWIYADLIESRLEDPLQVKKAALLSKPVPTDSSDGSDAYDAAISLTFRTRSAETWREKSLAIRLEKQAAGSFQIIRENNLSP